MGVGHNQVDELLFFRNTLNVGQRIVERVRVCGNELSEVHQLVKLLILRALRFLQFEV